MKQKGMIELESCHILLIVMIVFISYPMVYEIVQLFKITPKDYFKDIGNYFDLVYIIGSFVMSYVHWHNPYTFLSRLLMSLIVTLAIRRTF